MTTLRQRLTFWYTGALGATILVFGASLYLDRRVSSLREIDQRLQLEAELSAGWLTESRRVVERLIVPDPVGIPTLDPAIAAYFEAFRDYLVIVSPTGQLLFLSVQARALPPAAIDRLLALVQPPVPAFEGTTTISTQLPAVRYLIQPVPAAAGQIGVVLVAATTNSVLFGPAALLRSMVVSLPILLLGSVLLGFWLAGTALKPLDAMVAELEAIADGRSLHRRLPVPAGADETQRLALAANRTFARLEDSFSALYRFTADASHELKTPLMVLRAGVERTLTNPNTPPENLEALDVSLAEINRMSELVENLLMLARADEGRAPLVVTECDLRDLLAEAADTAGILAEDKGITVTTSIPEKPVRLPVDRARFSQMLLNLVTNAIKYTPEAGEVLLELIDAGEDVTILVRDTGIGIAPGDLPHIFDRFWRSDPARSRVGQPTGTGLGLAITKWIAEAHGGEITVQSRPGRGTTFTVRLPRATESSTELRE
jgi:signal transduction histidine kinase